MTSGRRTGMQNTNAREARDGVPSNAVGQRVVVGCAKRAERADASATRRARRCSVDAARRRSMTRTTILDPPSRKRRRGARARTRGEWRGGDGAVADASTGSRRATRRFTHRCRWTSSRSTDNPHFSPPRVDRSNAGRILIIKGWGR